MRGWRKRVTVYAAIAVTVLSPGFALSRTAQSRVTRGSIERGDLREAMLLIYVHGVDDELAKEVVADSDLPELRRMLSDPSFPRRDNVVAFLAHRDGDKAVGPLLDLLADPPVSLAVPEEERALLLVPQALGELARRGTAKALAELLAMTEEGTSSLLSQTASRAPDSRAFLSDLQESALRGLALSGAPEARERLTAVAEGQLRLSGGSRDVSGFASDAIELLDRRTLDPNGGGAARPGASNRADRPVAPLDGASAVDLEPGGDDHVDVNVVDTQGSSHDSPLSFANHVAVTNPMTDAQATAVLRQASLKAAREDYSDDVRCCVSVSKSGTAQSFGAAGDGLDIIDNDPELQTVLNNPVSRVKVVRGINWCGGPGTNIIGCAWRPGNGIAVVRFSTTTNEGALWMHEWGHNTGLPHSADSRAIMYFSIGGTPSALLTQAECNAYHSPSVFSGMTPVVTGVCSDADNDLIASSADNCPNVANNNQADGDGDGLGDVCDPCPTSPPPAPPASLSPAAGATGIPLAATLDWSDVAGATSYDVQVATDAAFASVVRSASTTASTWVVSPALANDATYYWRTRVTTVCGTGAWSAGRSFITVEAGYVDCGAGCSNLALGKPITYSGLWNAGTNPQTKLNDTNTGTTNACEGASGYCAIASDANQGQAAGNFFQIDLGAVKSIQSVRVFGRRDQAFTQGQNLLLKLSQNGTTWTTYPMADTTMQAGFLVATGRLARYVKVETTTIVYLSLYEVIVTGLCGGGAEVCDGDDDNCDGLVDASCGLTTTTCPTQSATIDFPSGTNNQFVCNFQGFGLCTNARCDDWCRGTNVPNGCNGDTGVCPGGTRANYTSGTLITACVGSNPSLCRCSCQANGATYLAETPVPCATCGNGICEPDNGEWCDTCPGDCAQTIVSLPNGQCEICDRTGEMHCGPGTFQWCCY